MKRQPLVSVIIPCYNLGRYLDEAVDSVLAQTYSNYEIIIINDGSTDKFTNLLLKKYNKPKTRVIHTNNQGLAAARNNGIKAARGKYILPLDADDKIHHSYIDKAVAAFKQKPQLGIVYAKAKFFGEVQGPWLLPEFSRENMQKDNCIFCAALFPRTAWTNVNGYDESMRDGLEDYAFWISFLLKGYGVLQLPQTLFFYRIRKNSMFRQYTQKLETTLLVKLHIWRKNFRFFGLRGLIRILGVYIYSRVKSLNA